MEMSDYRVRFTAVAEEPLGADAAARLQAVLENMPGAGRVDGAEQDDRARRVSAGFWIEVRLGMADAARDGSRLAKEALKGAGMAEAQLVELSVWLGAADSTPGGR
ncbi:MAG: hypothetical protein QOD86_1705 [Miltoncostaeaceae bacterium]|jgi:hypothetical protein|nr:hypothetical protein [Miltoncostaeaceae bacterium]